MPVEIEKQSKVEQAWNRLVDKFPDSKVLVWDKQSRQIQDTFIQAINHYGLSEDASIAYMVFSNAARG